MSKRILAMLLAVMLLVGMLPTNLFAFTASAEEGSEAASVSMEALVAETEITVDGALSEAAWSSWMKIPASAEGAPSGRVAAAWNLETLYLAINADADTAALTVNGRALTVDLSAGTVTGAANAVSAGTGGVVEISIPLASLGIVLSKYDQSVAISGSLSKGGDTSSLAADKLILTGKVATAVDISAATATNQFTIEGNSATLNKPTAASLFLYISADILAVDGFAEAYNLKFTALPESAGTPTYTADRYTGFNHYFLSPYDDPNSAAAKVQSVVYGIYRTADSGLMLVVRGDDNTQDYTFALNRGLNEEFRLTCQTYADGSAELFVDGVSLGTVNGAVHWRSGFGKEFSLWRYFDEAGQDVNCTISDLSMLQTKYVGSMVAADLDALVAEDAVQVDGELSEIIWSNWMMINPSTDGAPSGELAAAWDFVNLYLAIKADAATADLTVNGKTVTVDLSTGAVTGAAGAVSEVGTDGAVEIAIPMASLDIALSEYGQSVDVFVSLSKSGVTSALAANKLILSGKIPVVVDFKNPLLTSDCTVSEDGSSATLSTKMNSYMLFQTPDIDMSKEFMVTNSLKFTELPVYTPAYNANGYFYLGYNQYFSDPSGNGIVYSIYRPAENADLVLVMRGDNDTKDYTFALNRGLDQEFKLTCVVYADGSAELFVDGVSLGTVAGVVRKATLGESISGWRWFPYDATLQFSCTVSDVKMTQDKYADVVTPPKETMEALVVENDVTVDGKLNEFEWSNYFKIPASVAGAPSGGVSAIWDRDNLYFAFNTKDAETAKLTLGGKELSINLADGTVTGADGAEGKVGDNGAVEVAIPWTALGIQGSPYEMEISMALTLVGEDANSVSSAKKLIITGMVMSQIEINSFSPNTVFTQEGETVTMKASPDGVDNYFLYQSSAISMAGEFLESYNLKITKLPVSTPTYSAGNYTGFNHYFVGPYEGQTIETKRVMYGIYRPSEDSGLMLVVRGNMGIKDYTFDLNRDLDEEFRLACLVHADGSADFFVDGDYLGTVKGAVSLVTGFGKSMSLWRYKDTGAAADVEITVSQLGRMEQKYASLANMLKIRYVLGRSLSKVTGNLDLPNLLPNSEILGDIPITWQSTDESVLKADGTVTRHETELKTATLTLLHNGQVKDTAVVTVAPLNVVEYPGTGVLTVGFAGTAVVMDGSVAEEGWPMHGRMINDKKILVAEFGAQWDADYLYLAVDTVTKGVPFVVTLNGKAFHVSGGKLLDSSDAEVAGSTVAEKSSVVEIKIPVAALGLTDSEDNPITRIEEYDYKVPIALTVAEVSYEGILHLSKIDWWAVENRQTTLPVRDAYANTIANGGGAPDGDQGVEKVESGYRFYDLYSDDGKNPASVRSYVIMMNEPIYENFGNRPVACQVNFDFVANALPVYDDVTGIDESQTYSNYGLTSGGPKRRMEPGMQISFLPAFWAWRTDCTSSCPISP